MFPLAFHFPLTNKMAERLKLPKQWNHWLRRLNLRKEWHGADYYYKGRGYHWRIGYHYYGKDSGKYFFQRGDTYADMDRWALADTITHEGIPQTFAELKQFVESALNPEFCAKYKADYDAELAEWLREYKALHNIGAT